MSSAPVVLRPPSFSPGAIGQQLLKLVRFRDLLLTLTLHRIAVRYKQSVLGYYWATLYPLLLMIIYTIIFGRFAHVQTNGLPYAVFAFSALLPWTFFSNALSTATLGLVSHSNLVLKVSFPREIIPLAYVFAALIDFLLASLILAAMMFYWRVPVTPNILWVAPAMLTLLVFASALALFLSAFQVRFRDVGMAMPLLLQLWMFATPVVYPLSSVPAKFRTWYDLNPMVGIVETFRAAVLHSAHPRLGLLTWSLFSSVVLALAAYLWFKHVETTFADII